MERNDPMHPVTNALLAWYDRCARTLPWRNIHDPYRTWVSEAMLQQTRVETVLSYYERFLVRFPSLQALAEADEPEVLKMWEGLGYYSRARNLWQGARKVMAEYGGSLPADVALLRTLPGVGPYMAGAIASIAFNIPVPAVDGNVIRVISRLDNIRENASTPSVRRLIEQKAASLVPANRPGDHNQAMMDLGAGICVPGTPDCDRCPVSAFCLSHREGDPATLPVLPGARPPKIIPWTVLVIRSETGILLRRRTEKLLQGLWCFPMLEGHLSESEVIPAVRKQFHITPFAIRSAGSARHVFTHQVWQMNIFVLEVSPDSEAPSGYMFVSLDEMEKIALPAAMNAARRAI